ncbi:hypothetical protein PFFCH_00551 [Plasmodium falciparum FCH/4]|uniref:Plasmodium falciparum erythrocyte membrane protein 1 acidic terminal segment domain-containing protein n=1 Tax=Plasmodium falciparum FCH/4 TaxID=1036724 RepID=A0A024VUZ4_PLAFA|nr:hypothetical protein PFFCH_00551 [Plasmodium falciparum FCH/4]
MLLWMKNLLLYQFKIDFLVVIVNNRNRNIDIYDEMLERKEKELLLDLFHQWLDRHRDMCEKWKSKEDILHKLNEEWTMEHNEDLLDIMSSSHDDILKIKDETYNIISTKNIYNTTNMNPPSNKSDERISCLAY